MSKGCMPLPAPLLISTKISAKEYRLCENSESEKIIGATL
jgi:hypothetical protein